MSAAPPAAAPVPVAPPAAPPAALQTAPAVKTAKQVTDQQTGKIYQQVPERWFDIAAAWISATYSLAVIGYLTFMVLYMLSGRYAFWPEALTNKLANLLTGPVSKLILYTAIGGAMGAAVNNLRSFISWHAEEKSFGWRFVWKYLAMPPLGGTLAVLVYGILQGGIAVINGGAVPNTTQLTSLSAWATGTLAGYGSAKVFIWLDDKVNTLFKIDKRQVAVPDMKGKSLDEAKQMVSSAELVLGTISEQTTSSDQVGRVIQQTPNAGTQIDCGSKVDLTVGIAGPEGGVDPTVAPELAGAAKNGNGSSPNGNSVVVTEAATTATVTVETEAALGNGSGAASGNGTGTVETTASETSADSTEAAETKEATEAMSGEPTDQSTGKEKS